VTTWTPSPVRAFKYAGKVAINVLPSPSHLGDLAVMQGEAADELDVEMP